MFIKRNKRAFVTADLRFKRLACCQIDIEMDHSTHHSKIVYSIGVCIFVYKRLVAR